MEHDLHFFWNNYKNGFIIYYDILIYHDVACYLCLP
jgi:hypothetical protein